MKRNILFLVHVEDSFRHLFPPMFTQRLTKAVQARKYDRVIHMTSHIDNDEPIQEIQNYGMEQIDWAWGYDKDCFDGQPEELRWVIPTSSPHETTWVCPEVREMDFSNVNVFIGGGCDGECLQGFEDCLTYLDVPFKRVEGYIYNT